MFRGMSRKRSRQTPYYNGTNYVSRSIYQYGEGIEILDEMPRFIPREGIQDIVMVLQRQIDKLKENTEILEQVVYSTTG
jgi:hypothetical protein